MDRWMDVSKTWFKVDRWIDRWMDESKTWLKVLTSAVQKAAKEKKVLRISEQKKLAPKKLIQAEI